MWGLGSYGRLGLGEVMDVPLARRTGKPCQNGHGVDVCYAAMPSFMAILIHSAILYMKIEDDDDQR